MGAYINPILGMIHDLVLLPWTLAQERRMKAEFEEKSAYLDECERKGISPYPLPPGLGRHPTWLERLRGKNTD